MEAHKIQFITGTRRERIAIGSLSLPMAACCVWLARLADTALRDIPEQTTLARTLVFETFRRLATELFTVATLFLMLGFIWAVFRPRWADNALLKYGRRVWQGVCLVFFGLLVLAAGLSLLQHVR